MSALWNVDKEASPFYTEHHRRWQLRVREFIEKEVEPYVNEWDEKGGFDRALHMKAAEAGIYNAMFDDEIVAKYGGKICGWDVEGRSEWGRRDIFYNILGEQELTRPGSGGVMASLFTHTIGLPPILFAGSEELKNRVVPSIFSGEKIICLGITEPQGGSDVASIRTSARKEGNEYVVNGWKQFITSGVRADYYTVAVRTGDDKSGMGGISLLLLEKGMPGLTVLGPARKMGWLASDTAILKFDNVRVPVENLIGEENNGFLYIMLNFNSERIGMASQSVGFARVCLADAIKYAQQRKTFGKRLADHQVIRHKLADMARRVNAAQSLLELTAWRVQRTKDSGKPPSNRLISDVCLLKVEATQTMEFCAREALQIFGGHGYMRSGPGSKVERIYREVRVMAIGGGSEEIMKDLATRQCKL